jgi:TonB family protein
MTDALGLVLKVSALLAAGLLAMRLSACRSASFRHWLLAATIVCGLATPMVAAVAPAWHRPLPWTAPAAHAVTSPAAVMASGDAEDTAVVTITKTGVPAEHPDGRSLPGPVPFVLALWLVGVAVAGLPLVIGLFRLRWLAHQAQPVADPRWLSEAAALRRPFGVSTPVRLLQSPHPALLVTWGWRVPTILLPAGAGDWSAARIRIVLSHELAHIARADWATQLAAELLRVLHWFNPLAWLTCRRLRLESECACDDLVLAQGIDPPDYADHLLALARSLHAVKHPSLPAPAMARPSSLEGRVRAMLNHTHDRRPVSSGARAAIAAGLLILTVVISGLQAQTPLVPVSGTAYDPTGRVLPNVRVVLTHTGDQSRFEVLTDRAGRYAFAAVPAATYTIEARLAGFSDLSDTLPVTAGTTHDLLMQVGTLRETITIRTDPTADASTDVALAERRDQARRRFAELADSAAAKCKDGVPSTAVGGNIFVPRKLVHVAAVYPDALKASNTGGTVTMTAVIGTDGMVRDIQHVRGPHPELSAAAEDAVRQWQFSTTLLNCEPIEVQMTVTTNFVAR